MAGRLSALLVRGDAAGSARARTVRYVLGAVLAGAAIWSGTVQLGHWRAQREGRAQVAQLAAALDAARQHQKQAGLQMRQLVSRVGAAQPSLTAAAPLLAQAQLELAQAAPVLQGALPDPDTVRSGGSPAFLAEVARRRAAVASAQTLLDRSQAQLQRVEQLLAAQSGLTQLQRQYSEAAMWEPPPIRQRVRAIQSELEQPGGTGAAAAMAGIGLLGRQLADASAAAGYLDGVRSAVAKLQTMGLSAADRGRAVALLHAANAAAALPDVAQVKALAADAQALLARHERTLQAQAGAMTALR